MNLDCANLLFLGLNQRLKHRRASCAGTQLGGAKQLPAFFQSLVHEFVKFIAVAADNSFVISYFHCRILANRLPPAQRLFTLTTQ
jgi:hypothetical protein